MSLKLVVLPHTTCRCLCSVATSGGTRTVGSSELSPLSLHFPDLSLPDRPDPFKDDLSAQTFFASLSTSGALEEGWTIDQANFLQNIASHLLSIVQWQKKEAVIFLKSFLSFPSLYVTYDYHCIVSLIT